jgi:flagellin
MSSIDSRTTLIALTGMRSAAADVAKASERITTGLRINRASDDPAGFAKGMRLQAEISSFEQVKRNLSDSSGLVNQVSDALSGIVERLSEMRAAALEASAETDADKRTTLAATFDAARQGITDIVDLVKVGSDKVMEGYDLTVQVGIEFTDTKDLNFADVSTGANGLDLAAADFSAQATAGALVATLDTALETVLGELANVGGFLNTLESTSDFIDSTIFNKTIQYKDVMDADMALEATNLAAAKIRQDASTAVLAQANSMNRSVADYLLNGALG